MVLSGVGVTVGARLCCEGEGEGERDGFVFACRTLEGLQSSEMPPGISHLRGHCFSWLPLLLDSTTVLLRHFHA